MVYSLSLIQSQVTIIECVGDLIDLCIWATALNDCISKFSITINTNSIAMSNYETVLILV